MKQFLKYLAYAAAFLAAVYLVTLVVGDFSIAVKFDKNDALQITGPRKSSVTVPYSEIDHIELITLTDPGEKAGGGSSRSRYWGKWKNEAYGEYDLFVNRKNTSAVLVQTDSGNIVVFNLEDAPSTMNMFHMFEELLNNLDRT